MSNNPISDLRRVLRASLQALGDSFAQGQDVPNRGQRLDLAAARLERGVRACLRTSSEKFGQDGWVASDLDRCEHGRHSVDPCADCPGGWSTGNLYMTMPAGSSRRMLGATEDGTVMVRIGTTVHAEPINVPINVPIIRARPEEVPGA